MNIFVTNDNPIICAQDHCDKHVVKMIAETTQILSTARQDGYVKPTHVKHPCTLWAGECAGNDAWLERLGYELCKEYTVRYGKKHQYTPYFKARHSWIVTPFACAMPEPLKVYAATYGTIWAYRVYIAAAKRKFAKWKIRPEPVWWKDACLVADSLFPNLVNMKDDGVA